MSPKAQKPIAKSDVRSVTMPSVEMLQLNDEERTWFSDEVIEKYEAACQSPLMDDPIRFSHRGLLMLRALGGDAADYFAFIHQKLNCTPDTEKEHPRWFQPTPSVSKSADAEAHINLSENSDEEINMTTNTNTAKSTTDATSVELLNALIERMTAGAEDNSVRQAILEKVDGTKLNALIDAATETERARTAALSKNKWVRRAETGVVFLSGAAAIGLTGVVLYDRFIAKREEGTGDE